MGLDKFCRTKNIEDMRGMDIDTIQLFVKVSVYCIKSGKGDVELAEEIVDTYSDFLSEKEKKDLGLIIESLSDEEDLGEDLDSEEEESEEESGDEDFVVGDDDIEYEDESEGSEDEDDMEGEATKEEIEEMKKLAPLALSRVGESETYDKQVAEIERKAIESMCKKRCKSSVEYKECMDACAEDILLEHKCYDKCRGVIDMPTLHKKCIEVCRGNKLKKEDKLLE